MLQVVTFCHVLHPNHATELEDFFSSSVIIISTPGWTRPEVLNFYESQTKLWERVCEHIAATTCDSALHTTY